MSSPREKIAASGDILYITDPDLGHRLASNVLVEVVRKESSEKVRTNARGWRISAQGHDERKPIQLAVAGCSWAMGTGNEYEDSIVGHLEALGLNGIANLGVGSYSLYQTIKLISRDIEHLDGAPVLLLYGSWMLDRCLKDRANPIMFRPVLVKKKGGRIGELPAANAPNLITRMYTRLARVNAKSGLGTSVILKILEWAALCYHGYPMRLMKRIFGLHSFERLSHRDDRKEILLWCLNELSKIIESTSVKSTVTIVQLPEYFRRSDQLVHNPGKGDKNVIASFCKDKDNISFVPADKLDEQLTELLVDNGTTWEDRLSSIHWLDNNHPNSIGSQLIAEHIYRNMRQDLR